MGKSNGSGFCESFFGSFVEDKVHKYEGRQQKIFLGYPVYHSKGVTVYEDKQENNGENRNSTFYIIMYNINNYLPIWHWCYSASKEFKKGNIGTGLIYFGFGLVDGFSLGSLYREMSILRMSKNPILQLSKGLYYNISKKIEKQMTRRGWTNSDIRNVLDKPYTTRNALNKANGNPATAFYNANGHYVIRDNLTGRIIQISNKFDYYWQLDNSIINPYNPR